MNRDSFFRCAATTSPWSSTLAESARRRRRFMGRGIDASVIRRAGRLWLGRHQELETDSADFDECSGSVP
jgi:hypothetical protein